jgi:hypothetical protein
MRCLDCGNTTDFRVLFYDWSLVTKDPQGGWTIEDSLSFGQADNPEHPIECHDCNSTRIEDTE